MEAKINHINGLPFLKSRVRTTSIPAISLSFCMNLCDDKKRSLLRRRFKRIPEKWNLVFTQMKSRFSTKKCLIHVVKEGETLTSISRRYGVFIGDIVAVNSDIVNVDIISEGQTLNIPCSAKMSQTDSTQRNQSEYDSVEDVCQSPIYLLGSIHENKKIFTVVSSGHLKLAKHPGYFLLLVPLLAFCLRCIMVGTFGHGVAVQSKHGAVNESRSHPCGLKKARWRNALSDIMEPDVTNEESRQDPGVSLDPLEDQSGVPYEDISHGYTKLEPAYHKFLEECGMRKWGYWRGGSE